MRLHRLCPVHARRGLTARQRIRPARPSVRPAARSPDGCRCCSVLLLLLLQKVLAYVDESAGAPVVGELVHQRFRLLDEALDGC
jgi:hypothetical protein